MADAESKLRKANVELGVVLFLATIFLVVSLFGMTNWNPINAAYLLGIVLVFSGAFGALFYGLTAVILFLMDKFKG